MKKFLNALFWGVFAGLLVWVFLSWCDIVADNDKPNPIHHPMNFFIVTMKDKDTAQEENGACGDPLGENVQVVCGVVNSVHGNGVGFTDENGEDWYCEVGYGENFQEGDYLCAFIDTKGTDDLSDDEIVKFWKEVW